MFVFKSYLEKIQLNKCVNLKSKQDIISLINHLFDIFANISHKTGQFSRLLMVKKQQVRENQCAVGDTHNKSRIKYR